MIDVSEEYPIFYQCASMSPTTWDEDSKGSVDKGWNFINEDYWQMELHRNADAKFWVKFTEAPNEL